MTATPFADHGSNLLRAGFAVVPTRGKRPAIRGFNNWRSRPSPQTVAEWMQSYADANIAYIPGLSGPPGRKAGLIVVDVDSMDASSAVIDIFGDTPGKALTRRGMHLLYASPELSSVQPYAIKATALKALGIDADIKFGNSIVVAPPSRHPDEPTTQYQWLDCDPRVIQDLPLFDPKPLKHLAAKANSEAAQRKPCGSTVATFRNGSRGLALNDKLVSVINFFDTYEEALDYAHTVNMQFADHGIAKLDDEEVADRTRQVWQDRDELERWIGRKATATTHVDEIRIIASYPNGPDALMLVQLLRAEHGARSKRGEGFQISIDAMVRHRVLGDWSARRYRNARDVALKEGLIVVLELGERGKATIYGLTNRRLVRA